MGPDPLVHGLLHRRVGDLHSRCHGLERRSNHGQQIPHDSPHTLHLQLWTNLYLLRQLLGNPSNSGWAHGNKKPEKEQKAGIDLVQNSTHSLVLLVDKSDELSDFDVIYG